MKCNEHDDDQNVFSILKRKASLKNRTQISEFPSENLPKMLCSSVEIQPVEVTNGLVCVRGEKEFQIINVSVLPAPYTTSQLGGVSLTSGCPETMNWSSSQVWKCVTMAFNERKKKALYARQRMCDLKKQTKTNEHFLHSLKGLRKITCQMPSFHTLC